MADVLIGADAGADGLDHGLDFGVVEDFVLARFVGVDDLAPQRQDRLELAEAAPFGAAAGRIAFDQVQLALFHVLAEAIAELAGQRAAAQDAFAVAQHFLGLAGRFAGLGGEQPLFDDVLGRLGVLFQVLAEELAEGRVDDPFDLGIVQAVFRLGLRTAARRRGRPRWRSALRENPRPSGLMSLNISSFLP